MRRRRASLSSTLRSRSTTPLILTVSDGVHLESLDRSVKSPFRRGTPCPPPSSSTPSAPPGGKRNGKLSGWHPADLAAETLKALVERNDLDPALVDDVIMGCVMQVGAQGVNIGRNAVLAAGFPESVPATTVDRQCGSSQQSAHFAAQGVIAGAYDIVIAAGVEVMSLVPMGASMMAPSTASPFGPTDDGALRGRRRARAPGHLRRADRRQVGPVP